MSYQMWVDGLIPGERFMWCGRIVEIEKITPAGLYRRGPSRRIWVKLGEKQLRLHYYDDEWVTVVAGEDDALAAAQPGTEPEPNGDLVRDPNQILHGTLNT